MNLEIITIEDCLEAYELRGWGVILEDGQVTGFEKGGEWVDN